MADEPVSAWREPPTRTLIRWLTRHRTGVTAAAATLLMALGGLGVVSAVQARANVVLNSTNRALSDANSRFTQANVALEAANGELSAANLRERERFNLAMDAIKLFHGEISQDLLLKQRQFETLRARLLRGAADFYGRLEGLLKGREDPDSHAALGRAYEELGQITLDIGNSRDALTVFERALEVRRSLAAEPGADDRVRLDLARNLIPRGFLQEGMSDRTAGMASYQEALAIVKGIKSADGMTEPPFLVEARVTHTIGWLLHAMGREAESVAWLRRAVEIADRGIADGRQGAGPERGMEVRLFVANTLNALSGPLGATVRFSESLEDQGRALRIMRDLASRHPDDSRVANGLVATHFNIGGLYRSMARPAEAFAAFRDGLDVAEGLVERYPAVVEYRRFRPAASMAAATPSRRWAGRTRPSPTSVRRGRPGRRSSMTTRPATPSRSSWEARTTGSAGPSSAGAG
jgi:tetratricopeptide (TPR) repeat protein